MTTVGREEIAGARLKRLRDNPDRWAGGVVIDRHELDVLLDAYEERETLRALLDRSFQCRHGRVITLCLGCDADASADLENVMRKLAQLRKALGFVATDTTLTVDHLRGYADGVLKATAADEDGVE